MMGQTDRQTDRQTYRQTDRETDISFIYIYIYIGDVCIYVCVCVYMYTYIYIYIYHRGLLELIHSTLPKSSGLAWLYRTENQFSENYILAILYFVNCHSGYDLKPNRTKQ